jgi:hypothetical protein
MTLSYTYGILKNTHTHTLELMDEFNKVTKYKINI